MVKKLLGALCVLGVAMIAFALGRVADTEGAPPAKPTVLTGRTDEGQAFVTELDAGRFRWFDTYARPACKTGGHYDFHWLVAKNAVPFKWDGRHLAARVEGPTDAGGDRYTARLDATYDPETGLRGTIEIDVGWKDTTCNSGPIDFWAVADR